MDAKPTGPSTHRGPTRMLLSPMGTLVLAIALGLCGGYLDLVIMVFMKYCWNDLRYVWSGRDFPWSVPVAHALLMVIAGAILVLINWLRGRRRSRLPVVAWLFTTLALWMALLRLPLYGVCTLLLAAGLGRLISTAVVAFSQHQRRVRYALAGLFGLLSILAALSSGRQAIKEYRAMTALPVPARSARNVVLIVWDTVRAPNLSLYGYDRDTTPNLRKWWARQGVRYDMAMVPAPWTYPSHSSFFTGQWPYKLNTQWNSSLDATYPTLAEYLASRGYQTVGFAANTRCCSYESGLDRGFTHYEDYPLTPRFLLGRTVPGSWVLTNLLRPSDYFYGSKWIGLQSRDARAINDGFLDWLQKARRDRPFFAFLNYMDAHNPYVPPAEYAGRFGVPPKTREDYALLFGDVRQGGMGRNTERNLLMVRDRYDDCIASLDNQLAQLLNALRRQRLLDDTLVIITGDHGESFGDHNVFFHGTGLYIDQIAVPLVILSPDAPPGLTVTTPVSLRDLPATLVDQLGVSAGSPFPGRSLASFWSSPPGKAPPALTPALTELVWRPDAFPHQPQDRTSRQGFQMSLVASGWHYLRDGTGSEQIYDLSRDMGELDNLSDSPKGQHQLGVFRRMLLEVLTDNPGSIQVENAYLKPYRQRLKSLVQASSASPGPTAAVESP
jgi:arylsulfatase A-like enzyme